MKKWALVIVAAMFVVSPTAFVAGAFAGRMETCLNGEWNFQPVAGRGPLEVLPKGKWSKTKIRVPSSWTDTQESGYPEDFQAAQHAYYRRVIDLPADLSNKRVLIRFGAIYFASRVWVNGRNVGETRLAYVPYEMDITSAVKAGAGNELIVGVQGVDAAVEDGHAVLPCGGESNYAGLMDDVTLKIVPAVYISDIFVMPSVRNGKLTVQIEVTNPSDRPFSGKVRCDAVTLSGNPAKSLPEVAMNVPAGKTATVTAEAPWPDAKLWWPHDPHLYRLRTRLIWAGEDDETYTRFGFREFWCDGSDLKLNGKRIRLMQAHSFNFCWLHASLMQPENLKAKWSLLKEAHVDVDRLIGGPFPQVFYDTADECGMPIIAEGSYVPVAAEAVDPKAARNLEDGAKFGIWYDVTKHPELWKDYYRRWIRANRNHPSIVMWSLFNEMSWKDCLKPLIHDVARPLDPTRPMYCDGASDESARGSDDKMMTEGFLVGEENLNDGARFPDMNGLGDLLTSHYSFPTRTNLQSTDNPSYRFPEACYYLEGRDFHRSRTDGRIKPVGKGEYSFVWCAQPDWISFYGGDRAYREVLALNDLSNSGFWQTYGQIGRDEGHGLRYAGVNTLGWQSGTFAALATNSTLEVNHEFQWDRLDTPGFKPRRVKSYLLQVDPWSSPAKPRHVKTAVWPYLAGIQAPKLVLLVDPARTFEGGRKISRRVGLLNDTYDDAPDGKMVWTLASSKATLMKGEAVVGVEHGRTYKGTIELTLPAVEQPETVTFTVRWLVAGQEWGQREQVWEILPTFVPHPRTGKTLYCYDPKHALDPILKRLGHSVQPVPNPLPGGKDFSLLIAPSVLDRRAVDLVGKALRQGVNVAVLDQKEWPEEFIKTLGIRTDPGTRSMAFVRNPAHPILEGVARDVHLGHWGPEGQIADWALEKPSRGSYRNVVYADRDYSLLMELRGPGGGTCVLTTLQLAAWNEASPSAKRILANLIDYLRTAGPWELRPALLLAGKESPLNEALEYMTVRTAERGDSVTPILVDGRAAIDEKNLALLRRHLDAGGNVYLHALTPESLKTFGDLLPTLKLEPTGLTGCQNFEIGAFDPLTANLSGKDVYYPTVNQPVAPWVLNRSSLPKGTVVVAGEPEWTGGKLGQNLNAHLIINAERWKLAERKSSGPGAALAVVPCRKGKVVVCQLLWDEFFAYRNAANVGLGVLNGLGVDLTAPPKPAVYDPKRFVLLDLRPVCNTNFVDDTVDEDGKGGWGDQGRLNDLRDLHAGTHVTRGVPFRILNEEPGRPNTCLILWSSHILSGIRSAEVRTGVRCVRLHFLHASLWQGSTEARYVVHYRDGTTTQIPVRNGYEIDNWWVGYNSQARDAKIGWMGRNPAREPIGLWHYVWTNPKPDRIVTQVSFESGETSTSSVAIVAVTAELP